MDPMPAAALLAAPEHLHPALWRAHQLGRMREDAVRTGFAALDAQLPGGGWPRRALTELLLPHPGVGEMRLLAPSLAGIGAGADEAPRSVMLFDPPAPLCGTALAQLGVDARQLVVIRGRDGAHGARHLLDSADLLWALEQALKSGQVGAVLAWPSPRLRGDALRRLQLAAQAHTGPVFLLRDIEARCKPSPAPLRLVLHSAGIDALALRVLKRRGPALTQPLRLSLPPVLAPVPRARADAARLAAEATARARQGPAAGEASAVAGAAAPASPQAPAAGGGAAALPLAG
jgi:protein ImuA